MVVNVRCKYTEQFLRTVSNCIDTVRQCETPFQNHVNTHFKFINNQGFDPPPLTPENITISVRHLNLRIEKGPVVADGNYGN